MRAAHFFRFGTIAFATILVVCAGTWAGAGEETAAQAGEQIGVEGTFVRVATNEEGWVVLGYQAANGAVGKEWILLDVGITLRQGVKDQKLTRDKIALVTPDHKVIPLATQRELEEARASLAPMERADNMMHDSINYFPPGSTRPCRIGFFTDPGQAVRGPAFDQVELSSAAACAGRLYFKVPGGLQLGNYNLDVTFEKSVVKVPMEIMDKEREKEFTKQWKEAEKTAKNNK